MTPYPFPPAASVSFEPLAAELSGDLLRPGDTEYQETRALWNGMIDKHPAAIVRCADAADAILAVDFARRSDLRLAVRGGGHNVAGLASVEDGLVIDLGHLNQVEVDPVRRVARVGGGATIGDLDRATQRFGLAAPMGVVSATGVAGLTLGGGMGWLRRRHGLSCDNLIAAEVVTADGTLVRTSETERPELLWALRGGGGNFGIVTAFEFRLVEIGPEVAFTFVFYPLDEAHRVLRAHEAFLAAEPGDVSTIAVLGRVPHADLFAQEIQGAPFVGLLGMHAGNAIEGMAAMRPLREITAPLVDLSGPMPYLEAQTIYDEDYPDGMRYYWKSTSLQTLSDEAIDVLVRYAEQAPSDHSTLDVWYHGGAVAAPAADATAYGRRDIPYLINAEANWDDPADDDANVAWARTLLADLEPFSEAPLYLNFPGFLEEGDALVQDAYGDNHRRLVALKTRWDPDNLFRMNQNIRPEGWTP